MAPSLKYILEMLIVLSEDDVEEVADISKKALEHFINKTPTINQRQLLDMLEENFNNVFTKLPRYLNKLGKFSNYSRILFIRSILTIKIDYIHNFE